MKLVHPDPIGMEGGSPIFHDRSMKPSFFELFQWLCLALFIGAAWPQQAVAQGSENFSNIPTVTPGSYLTRSWTGTDGFIWGATLARTDETLTGKAICTNGTGTVTSPVYNGGMGTLQFNYVRAFTGAGARSFTVWVNGVQIGGTTTVSATSNTVVQYSELINVGGNVSVEIRTSGAQIKIDDISWTAYTAGPTVIFDPASQSQLEGAGAKPVDFLISPATVTGGTITVGITNGTGVFYGAGGDYSTTPNGVSGSITITVPAGASSATFNVNLINDLFWEPTKTITFAITGVTGDLLIGSADKQVFTIVNDDTTPTAFFSPTSANYMESTPSVNIPITITPAATTAGSITLSITNGTGALYGADYTTVPNGSSGSITLSFPVGATTVNIPVALLDDAVVEALETVTFAITGTTGGLQFGPSASTSFKLNISDNDGPPTVLGRGDLVIIGVNANRFTCGGPGSEDEISFFCFKDINVGTTLDLTDNGYSRCTPGLWGDSEGFLRITRTGTTIPRGTVITLRIFSIPGTNTFSSVSPDAFWSWTMVNRLPNLNSDGDQIFFLQGGTWNDPPGNHNASYTGGSILYGFSTNGQWLPGQCSTADANQHSGQPPQMECFSMEPTTASDFTKYSGPMSATTQRGWIIRIGEPTNWSTYSSCSTYSSGGTNYAGGFTFPITTVGFTPGLWNGSVSTDWFDCKNWDDASVPVATDDVRIDQSATRNCEVGIVAGSTATCASLIHTTSNGIIRSLTVQNSSTLQINGLLRIERQVLGTPGIVTTVKANSTLQAGSVEISGITGGTFEAILRCKEAGARVLVESDLTLGTGALLDLQSTLGNSGLLELGGDFINLNDQTAFLETYSTVRLNGNADQIISTSAGAEVFGSLEVLKTGGDVLLASPVDIRSVLNLSNGRIQNSASSLLTLMSGSTVTNASDASFVTGPVQKVGNTNFIFPVGKGLFLRPCSLSTISGGTGNAFTAEYIRGHTHLLIGDAVEPALDHVSDCEYWMIDRNSVSGNATVTLSWDVSTSCGVTELSSLRVARWDGSLWLDRGNGGATGTLSNGYIPTAAVQTVFGPWTLASISNENPLPITLLSFDAQAAGSVVNLFWATASEMNNEHFTVERSADGNTFLPLLRVPGAGNSTVTLEYGAVDDAPLQGLSYYRLRQTDYDGTSTLSNVVSVRMNQLSSEPLSVHVGDVSLRAFHSFEAGSSYSILDMTGRLVSTGIAEEDDVLNVSVLSLPSGAYVLRMQDGQRSESVRFIR